MQAIPQRSRRSTGQSRAIPRPGGIFDPVARALEVIGDRWTLVLVRQLLAAPCGFQELRQRTGIAPRVLSSRLRELVARGFVRTVADAGRPLYALSDEGRLLERGLEALGIDPRRFNATSARSVLEALPFMVREDRARGVDLVFEIRLEGDGGGVWVVHIHEGTCSVRPGFAERAHVRYTADARVWCGVALGLVSARDMHRQGLMSKEGGREALDHYFHQVPHPERTKEKAP
jgi:DNA-binding HxlR family transcriptional regulator